MSDSTTDFTSTRQTSDGALSRSTLNHTQRRQRIAPSSRAPTTVKRFFMSQLFGTITVSRLRVSMAVWRQRMSTMRPLTSSTRTQSPTSTESSSCRTMPPRMLPSVSCMENAITAVMTADVVKRLVGSTPAVRSHTNTHPMTAAKITRSWAICTTRKRTAGSATRNSSSPPRRITTMPRTTIPASASASAARD